MLLGATVFGAPLVYFGGYVSPDSSHYLQAAQHFTATGDFDHVAAWGDGRSRMMTTWPLAFPALVAAFSGLGLDVWSASKALSWLLLLANLALVLRVFGGQTKLLAPLVFLLPSCLRIHVYSWSEQLFLTALLCTLVAAQRLRTDVRWWPALAAALTLAFTTRYIGAFAPLAVLGGALAWRRLPHRRWFIVAAGLALALDAAYLLNNFRLDGTLTGGGRLPAPEGIFILSFAFVRSLAIDTAPYLLLLGFGALGWIRLGRARLRDMLQAHPDAVAFIGLGAAYLGALFILRNVRHFDMFNPRLTFVGSGFVLIGLIQIVEPPRWLARLTAAGVVLYAASWAGGHIQRLDRSQSAQHRLASIEASYDGVPTGSILIAPNRKFGYLEYPQRLVRPDLFLVVPRAAPYQTPETGTELRARVRGFADAHPGAQCFVDDTAIEDLEEHRARILARGLLGETAEVLLSGARPGKLRPLPDCEFPTPNVALPPGTREASVSPAPQRASIVGR